MFGRDKEKQDYRDHTLIARSAEVKGDLVFTGGLHVQGRVEGNISVTGEDGQLTIGETGVVVGEIRVPKTVINGRVEGDVYASERIELAAKAVIEGNVYYNLIEMVMGAQVDGKLVHDADGGRRNLPSPDHLKDSKGKAADSGSVEEQEGK